MSALQVQLDMNDDELDGALVAACESIVKREKRPNKFIDYSATDFKFPFEPYSIQIDFMRNLIDCIDMSKFGIFESPTGTGKSLSLICASFAWLNKFKCDFERSARATIEHAQQLHKKQDSVDDWLNAHEATRIQCDLAFELKHRLEKLDAFEERLNKSKQIASLASKVSLMYRKRPIVEGESNDENTIIDTSVEDDFALEDYLSDDDSNSCGKSSLLNEAKDAEQPSDDFYARKIFYAARTHSQLSQFVHELKKTEFGRTARVITLASRQNMCLNEKVNRLGHVALINDACLQMQRQKMDRNKKRLDGVQERRKKGGSGCPFYRTQAMRELADNYLCEVQDIEELVESARKAKCCPYYASRFAVAGADLVLSPYQILLNKSARQASDIRLEGNVVIIDEAHNLIDALNSVHSCKVDSRCLKMYQYTLEEYLRKYRSRLNPSNLMYLKHLAVVLKSLIFLLQSSIKDRRSNLVASKIYRIVDFLFECHVADINFFKLSRYMLKSKISQKLSGFARSMQTNSQQFSEESISSPVQVEAFIKCLTSLDKDGRILVDAEQSDSASLKFLSLNPAAHIKELLEQPRSLILAGGTMRPISDIVDQLLEPNGVPQHKLHIFSCGHVIPKSNILPIILTTGPTKHRLEFTYQTRCDPRLIDELGRLLIHLCDIVPGGLVCFFVSYDYEKAVQERFEQNGVLNQLQRRKRVFSEPKSSNEVPHLLEQYVRCTKAATSVSKRNAEYPTGAILFAVVGGKLSEGINFSDDSGRCVVVVGMPYPSKQNVELKEKIAFLSSNCKMPDRAAAIGHQYYENLCWKAINQSIGRAIRHKNDYAAILLLDARYSERLASTKNFLPPWIADSLIPPTTYDDSLSAIRHFFTLHDVA